jgi:hypothetical protein
VESDISVDLSWKIGDEAEKKIVDWYGVNALVGDPGHTDRKFFVCSNPIGCQHRNT